MKFPWPAILSFTYFMQVKHNNDDIDIQLISPYEKKTICLYASDNFQLWCRCLLTNGGNII